jgi:hypothetical protein
MAINDDGLWTHTKYGYSVPRRNGKNEIVAMRELYGLLNGEKILHTAHRTTTSHSASLRLTELLDALGYIEVQRMNKEKLAAGDYTNHYTYSKQFGLERVSVIGLGQCDFRTRSGKGGLGEGFDLLIIDEAQDFHEETEEAAAEAGTEDAAEARTDLQKEMLPEDIPLDALQVQILRSLLEGGDAAKIMKDNHLMPSIVADAINEAFFDEIGDTVLLCEGDLLSLVEDYIEDVENYLGG